MTTYNIGPCECCGTVVGDCESFLGPCGENYPETVHLSGPFGEGDLTVSPGGVWVGVVGGATYQLNTFCRVEDGHDVISVYLTGGGAGWRDDFNIPWGAFLCAPYATLPNYNGWPGTTVTTSAA